MRIGPKDGSRARSVVVRRCRSADKGQRARVRVDGECRNLTGVLLHCIKKISGRADNNEPRTIAGGNRRTHHGEAAGIGVNGEYGDVIGNNIADVSEAPGGLHRDDARIRTAARHRAFEVQMAGLRLDGISRNAIGKQVCHERKTRRGGRRGAEVLTAPQPAKSMGSMKIRMERAIFLTDMPILLVEI